MESTTYNLGWKENSFLSTLLLFIKSIVKEWKKINSLFAQERASGYSDLSSVYNNITDVAFEQLKAKLKAPWWLLWLVPLKLAVYSVTWLPLGLWCYLRMGALSSKVVNNIHYFGMSAEQCDVRQKILRKHSNLQEAKRCIKMAFEKKPKDTSTKGLLYVGLAEVYQAEIEYHGPEDIPYKAIQKLEYNIQAALAKAYELEKINPLQAIQIYRRCAQLTEGNDIGEQCLVKANELAKKLEALKLKAA
ncbi:MAG: hypothetical protein WCW87_04205 [Candidatus Paceibacterota bacterium]